VLTKILFESLWMLAAVWVPLQFILIAVWSWRRSRPSARAVWVGFAALPMLMLVSSVVVTQREQIIALCEDLGGFVEDGDVDAIGKRLADACEVEDLDRDAFLSRVEDTLARYHIWDVGLGSFETTFSSDGACAVEFHATARVRSNDIPYEWFASRWRLNFRRIGDSWLVTKIKPVPTPQGNLPSLADLLR
jgi:hypothetical protein